MLSGYVHSASSNQINDIIHICVKGAVPNPYTVRVRIVTMVTTIIRGNTPEESEVKELFASRAEFDEILLHGWNSGMAAWAALSQLDRWHMHWYKLFATGMILIGQVHHGASQFDVKVMVRTLN